MGLYFIKEQVRASEKQSNAHLAQSQKFHAEAVAAKREAKEIEEHARKILDTMENYRTISKETNQQSQRSIQEANELTSFHESRIDYAVTVSQSLYPSYNSSPSLIVLARNVEKHARDESGVSYSLS